MPIHNPKTDGNEDLEDLDANDRPDDEVAVRYVELDERKFEIRATDPYGLWHIRWDKGRVPNDLAGHFTSPLEAENALKGYLAAKKHKASMNAPATSSNII